MSTLNIRKYGLIAITQIIGFYKLRKRWQRLPNKICFCVIIFGCFFLQSPSSGPTQPVCHLCWVLWQFSRCLLSSISIAFLSTGYPLKNFFYKIDLIAYENFLTNSSSLSWQLDQSGQRWDISKFSDSKISSDMEVASRYTLLTLLTVFTLFILLKLLYTA